MSEFKPSANWSRLLIEGLVIVISILLAFAIDAWWDERQYRESELKKIARISAELNLNAERIQGKIETLDLAIDVTSKFISWMGPHPENVQTQEFLNAWTQLFSIGTFSLTRSASENFLATGNFDRTHNADIHQAVTEWYSLGGNLEKQYELLRNAHAMISEYIQDSIPTHHLISDAPIMAKHPKSKFPFDQTDMLSDPHLESRLAHYLIRMEFVRYQAKDLLERHEKLHALMN
jgi:hypothetical protein